MWLPRVYIFSIHLTPFNLKSFRTGLIKKTIWLIMHTHAQLAELSSHNFYYYEPFPTCPCQLHRYLSRMIQWTCLIEWCMALLGARSIVRVNYNRRTIANIDQIRVICNNAKKWSESDYTFFFITLHVFYNKGQLAVTTTSQLSPQLKNSLNKKLCEASFLLPIF